MNETKIKEASEAANSFFEIFLKADSLYSAISLSVAIIVFGFLVIYLTKLLLPLFFRKGNGNGYKYNTDKSLAEVKRKVEKMSDTLIRIQENSIVHHNQQAAKMDCISSKLTLVITKIEK